MTINWILGLIQCTRLISHIHWKVFIPQNHFHQTWAGVTLTSFIVTLPRHKQCYSINVMDNCSERERERETTTITKQHVEMTSFQAEWEWEGKQGKVGNVTSPPPQTIFSLPEKIKLCLWASNVHVSFCWCICIDVFQIQIMDLGHTKLQIHKTYMQSW
jgi:hypothetical protein